MSAQNGLHKPVFIDYAPPLIKQKAWEFFKISRTPSHSLLHVRSDIHLYSHDEVPSFQQDNPFLTHGYRSYLSAKQCCKSVLIKSNELVNIWTHGGMFVYLFILLFYDQFYLLSSLKASVADHFIFLTFSVCSQACMLCSAGYHTFNCHVHEKVATRWYSVDLVGITVGMLGCYMIGLYYGFYCFNMTKLFYQLIVISMIVVSISLMIHPKYLSKRWRNTRILHLSMITISGLLPTLHWSIVSTEMEVKLFLSSVFILYAILGVALSFYLSKFPERYFPGRFNYIGHSHNWWHVFVAVSLWHWRNFAISVLTYRLNTTCLQTS
ncbi:progestin and adipoQ receptor family member 3-like [Ciona intestinalis]